MKNKVLFFDIDGTLATHNGLVSSNKTALQLLREKGHRIFIASGRPQWYVKNMFGDLIDGVVSSNGRHIEYHGTGILDKTLTLHEVQQIIDTCNLVKCGYLLVSDTTIYVGNTSYITDRNISESHYQKEYLSLQWNLKDIKPIYMFDIFYQNDAHFKEISIAFKDHFILNDHHEGSADASSISFNKGDAIAYVLSHLSIAKEDSFAFGDGTNDIDMFHNVGTAIAMGNANDVVKENADYITDDILNDGITKALIHFHLL